MRLLGQTTVTVHRYATPALTGGVFAFGAASDIIVVGSLQPASPKDLLALAEGHRARARWELYVPLDQPALRTVGGTAEEPADRAVVNGAEHDVIEVEGWPVGMRLDHRRYVLLAPERPAELP